MISNQLTALVNMHYFILFVFYLFTYFCVYVLSLQRKMYGGDIEDSKEKCNMRILTVWVPPFLYFTVLCLKAGNIFFKKYKITLIVLLFVYDALRSQIFQHF